MLGQQIGPYRIVGELGAGGMGVVYEAEDVRLQRRVAVKVLPLGSHQDRQAVDRFLREARIASSLSHPNICVIHDVGEHDGYPYIVMERIDGEPLSHIIAGKRLTVARLLDLGCQIADALEAAHARGIVHRDVKPSNVLVTRRGEAKVLDFGVATLAGPAADEAATLGGGMTVAGLAVGTVSYMSPEQARGEESDARSDLFSFGVVLYEMATGRLPFGGSTTALLFDGLLNRAPDPPLALNPTLPPDLARTIERALEKDRALRFQSAADMRAELERVRRSLTTPFPDSTASTLAAAAPARSWRVRTLVATMVLFVVAAGAWWLSRGSATSALSGRDMVLVADFTNTTGDPVFDETLTQALSVHLQESPFLSLLSDQRVQDTLRLMQRNPDARVSGDVAREVCQRAGAAALLAGSIAPLGADYVVTIEAQRCHDGESIAREQQQARGKEQVLAAVGDAAERLRARLGESRASLVAHTTPVAEATTASLDALKAYSMGLRARRQEGDDAAIPLLQNAVEIDPGFALGHARLATALGNKGLVEQAAEHARLAYDHRREVSEYERLYIESTYHALVTGDYQQRVGTLKVLTQTYPRDYAAHNNLASTHMAVGDWDAALVSARLAVELAPDERTPVGNLAQLLFWKGQFDEADKTYERLFAMTSDGEAELRKRVEMAMARNDVAGATRLIEAAPPLQRRLLTARRAIQDWRLAEARRLIPPLADEEAAAGRGQSAAGLLLELSAFEMFAGDSSRALQLAGSARALDPRPAAVAGAAAIAGSIQPETGEQWLMPVTPLLESHRHLAAVYLAPARAAVALGRRRYAEVIEILAPASLYERRYGVITLFRGQAYRGSGNWTNAAREFEKIVAGRLVFGSMWPAAQFYLAEARARAADAAGAREAYASFLAALPRADADLPLIVEARRSMAN